MTPNRLFLFAGVYLVCGVASFFLLKGTVAIVLGVVLIGVALLWLRGAFTAVVRQNRRPDDS